MSNKIKPWLLEESCTKLLLKSKKPIDYSLWEVKLKWNSLIWSGDETFKNVCDIVSL